MRKGISYTMTLAVVAVVLVIGGVTVTTFFTGSVDSVSDILTGQNTASERQLCEQRVSRFCGSNPDGTSWGDQFPECISYSGQVDGDGDTECPLGGGTDATDETDETDETEVTEEACNNEGGTCRETCSLGDVDHGIQCPDTADGDPQVCCKPLNP